MKKMERSCTSYLFYFQEGRCAISRAHAVYSRIITGMSAGKTVTFALCAALSAASWNLHDSVSADDGITVELESIPGSPLMRATARGFIRYPPGVVFGHILEYDRYGEFMPHMAESSVLERKENSMRVRQRLNLPWPLADRWYISAIAVDSDRWKLDWETVEGNLRSCTGSWDVEEAEGGSLVTYSVVLDPGGVYPAWVVNSMQRRSLPQVIRALREFIEKEEGQEKTNVPFGYAQDRQ